MKKIVLFCLTIFVLSFLLTTGALAQKGKTGGGGASGGSSSSDESLPWGDCGEGKIDTAIGCIDISNQNALIRTVLTFAVGVGGGIAFLLMLVAGFMIMTSQGDPKRLQAGQELLSSAIMGLIMLIFSVFILELIGVKIFAIPGFSE